MWIVDPKRRSITVHRTLLAPTRLGEKDVLAGGDLLPGFAISVASVFEE